MKKPIVFISYSRRNEKEKDELLAHLEVLQNVGILKIWTDDIISPGRDWKREIEGAMAQASIAILLITKEFLTSKSVLNHEIPQLLERYKNQGVIVLPVIAKDCAWKSVPWLLGFGIN